MARCDCCGNEYDKAFVIEYGDKRHVFDSFECAIHMMAPVCAVCGCRVLGHGIEAGDRVFCCAHCARTAGEQGAVDRVSRAS